MLLDLDKESLLLERELADLRVEEHQREIEFIDSQLFVITHKIDVLQKSLGMVRSRMKVDKHDMLQYQQANNDIKKDAQIRKVDLTRKRTDLAAQKILMQQELEKLSDRYKISLSNMANIEDWEVAVDSISEGVAAFSVSLAQTHLIILERKIDEVRVELYMQDAKLAHAQALEDSVKSLYAITQVKFSDIDQLEKERAHYKDLKNTIQTFIKTYQDRTTELHAFIKSQYKKITNIKKDQERFRAYSPDDVAENQRKYNEGLSLLSQALKLIEDQSDASLKLSEQYAALIEQKEETLVLATFMLQELDLIGVWHRSNRAVTWDGVKQIIPNLITFAQNTYGVIVDYVINFHLFTDLYEFVTTSTSQLFAYILFTIFFIYYLSVLASDIASVIQWIDAYSDRHARAFFIKQNFCSHVWFLAKIAWINFLMVIDICMFKLLSIFDSLYVDFLWIFYCFSHLHIESISCLSFTI
jgi:hypothetical protein